MLHVEMYTATELNKLIANLMTNLVTKQSLLLQVYGILAVAGKRGLRQELMGVLGQHSFGVPYLRVLSLLGRLKYVEYSNERFEDELIE